MKKEKEKEKTEGESKEIERGWIIDDANPPTH